MFPPPLPSGVPAGLMVMPWGHSLPFPPRGAFGMRFGPSQIALGRVGEGCDIWKVCHSAWSWDSLVGDQALPSLAQAALDFSLGSC